LSATFIATTKAPAAKREHSVLHPRKANFRQAIISPIDEILLFQRTIGNHAVQELIKTGVVRAKLKIGQPNDIYEQEADRAAEQVMRMPQPPIQPKRTRRFAKASPSGGEETIQPKPIADQITPLFQRQVEAEEEKIQAKLAEGSMLQRQDEEAEEEELTQAKLNSSEQNSIQIYEEEGPEEEEEPIQAETMAGQATSFIQRQEGEPDQQLEEEGLIQPKGNPGQTPAGTPNLESRLHLLSGGGRPLPESTRDFFESRFGTDFSQVRIHTDSKAADAATAINAKAFTIGKDVVFGTGQYSPDTLTGQYLLGHELAHVIQQNKIGSRLQKRRNPTGSPTKNAPGSQELTPKVSLPLKAGKYSLDVQGIKILEGKLNKFNRRWDGKARALFIVVHLTDPNYTMHQEKFSQLKYALQKIGVRYFSLIVKIGLETLETVSGPIDIPRAYAKYLTLQGRLRSELEQIKGIRSKAVRERRQKEFLKEIFQQVLGFNPFSGIEIKKMRDWAETDWIDRADHGKGVKVTINEDIFKESLEKIIGTAIHESTHALQLQKGLEYYPRPMQPSEPRQQYYLDAANSFADIDAYFETLKQFSYALPKSEIRNIGMIISHKFKEADKNISMINTYATSYQEPLNELFTLNRLKNATKIIKLWRDNKTRARLTNDLFPWRRLPDK
jgi:hypothetical protein